MGRGAWRHEADTILVPGQYGQRLDEGRDESLWTLGLWLRITVVQTAIALLLSPAGIHAVLSFIVARCTRAIGVRVASGVSQRRLVAEVGVHPVIHESSTTRGSERWHVL